MAVRHITNAHVVVEFPAADGGQIELSNTMTEDYSVPVYLTRTRVLDDNCPPEVKNSAEAEGLVTSMIGFVRESDCTREFWRIPAYECYYKYLITRI